jgi:hypothetical protein
VKEITAPWIAKWMGKYRDTENVAKVVRVNPGRAIIQAVRRWFSTAAAQVRVPAACGVYGGQISIGAGFLRVLLCPLPIIPPISPSS